MPAPPSALPTFQVWLGYREPHAVNWLVFRVRSEPLTRWFRLWPVLSHSSSVNGLNVEPGMNPFDPPYEYDVL